MRKRLATSYFSALGRRFSFCLLRLVLLAILHFCSITLFAQYRFDTWTTDNGLPQNSVYAILQTRDGYLWLTTLDGLVRYDGIRFTVFDKGSAKGIRSNRFTTLFEDRNSNLWIGTEDGGVLRYHHGTFTTYSTADGLPHPHIISFREDLEGNLLILTKRGIIKWRDEKFIPYSPQANENQADFIYVDRSGSLWYVDRAGLHCIKNGKLIDYTNRDGVSSNKIINIFADSKGNYWIGTRDAGLIRLQDGVARRFTERDGLPDQSAKPVCEDRDGNIWIVTNKGLCIYNGGKFTVLTTAQGLSSNYVATVMEDREGVLWLGYLDGGISRITKQAVRTYSRADGLLSDNIYPIIEDRSGAVWIGGNALSKYNNGTFRGVFDEQGKPIIATALCEDKQGRLWIGDWHGAAYIENHKFVRVGDRPGIVAPVFAIHQDRAGNLWFATGDGVYCYKDGKTISYKTSEGLANNDVKAILEDRADNLWFATYGGLSRFKDGSFTNFTESDGLASNRVRSLYEDADGTLWIGTYDGGLSRFKDGKLATITSNDGLFNNGVFQILEDRRGNFWMSCNRGIYRVSRQQLNDFADGNIKKVACVAYDKQDGLLNTECNGGQQPAGIRARDGKLWFPTQGGVAVLDPERLSSNLQPPPVLIEAFKIDGVNADYHNSIIITPEKENLEIAFTALSFIKPEQVVFKYRLEGLDTDWVDAGNRRTAYYSHLPVGKFTFTVIAANADGVWNKQGASLQITIVPPFWKTSWFSALSLFLLAALAFTFYRLRVFQLRRMNAAQEAFSRRLIEAQEGERQRIAAELHDGLGQDLLIIKNRALLGLMNDSHDTKGNEQFEEISESVSQAIEDVREIAYNLRPYHLDQLGLTQAIEEMLDRVGNSTAIHFTSEITPLDGRFPKDVEIIIYRIVQECLNNIVKHSAATRARLEINQDAHAAYITITDNGCGFAVEAVQASRSHGFGLFGINERVRLIGGTLLLESASGQGTRVVIKLTINEAGRSRKSQ